MKYTIDKLLHLVGLTFRDDRRPVQPDMDAAFLPIHRLTRSYTMTSTQRMYALYKAIEYISKVNIGGDIVECGVWRGGSAMICAYTLMQNEDTKRNLYLYDTYAGMTRPTSKDRGVLDNASALKTWKEHERGDKNTWCYADLADVQRNLAKTKYPSKLLTFIKGKVEDTLPGQMPRKIALLRLDTDWYASTKHELAHLYPLLSVGGVLIIDDYGHWQGARRAVDEYFKKHHINMLLSRIDYSGRIGIKTGSTGKKL